MAEWTAAWSPVGGARIRPGAVPGAGSRRRDGHRRGRRLAHGMSPAAALALLRSKGLKFRMVNGRAQVGPRSRMTPTDVALFLKHRAAFVALLEPPPGATPAVVLLSDTPSRMDADAGQLLDEYGLRPAGLSRADLLFKYILPPGAAAEDLTPAAVAEYADALHRRLAALPAPVVLVPTGPLSLSALRRTPLPVKPAKQPTKKLPQPGAGPTWRLKGGAIAWPDTISAARGFVDGY